MKKILFILMLLSQTAYATNYCADGSIEACVKMHVDESPLTDFSGKSHTGALDSAGNPAYQSDSPSGYVAGSYIFTSDKVAFADSADFETHTGTSGVMSIVVWVKFTSLDTSNGGRTWIVTKGGASSYEFALYAHGNGSHAYLDASVWDSSGVVVMETANFNTILTTGTWYAVGLSYNRATPILKTYINGVLEGSQSSTGSASASQDTAGSMLLGKRGDGAGTALAGSECEFAYLGRAMTASEFLDIYNNGLDGNKGNPTVTTHFDTIQGGSIIRGGSIIN